MDTDPSIDFKLGWLSELIYPLGENEDTVDEFASRHRVKLYDENASTFDGQMDKYAFLGDKIAAQGLHEQLEGRYDASILDIGCGTGRVAERLLELGPYSNITGLDPAEGMVEVARKKNIYKDFISQYLYLGCGLEHDVYDAVISAGTFVVGHMKSDVLIELCNAVKSGGYVVVSMREKELTTLDEYKTNMRPTINKLVTEGRWKVVKDEVTPEWMYNHTEKGLQGHLFVFQKI